MKKMKYLAIFSLLLILTILVSFGVRYLVEFIKFNIEPMSKVREIEADILFMMEDFLYIPNSVSEDIDFHFDSLKASPLKSSEYFVSNYYNSDKTLYFSNGIAILDFDNYTFISSREEPDYFIDTYLIKETGDYMMIFKSYIYSVFLTVNLPLEDLDTAFSEYIDYLIEKEVIVL